MSVVASPLADTAGGFISRGLMDKPMARNLHQAGAHLTIHIRSNACVEALAGEGVFPVASPAEVASQTGDGVIFLMLTDSPATEQVVPGSNLLSSLAPTLPGLRKEY